MSIGEPRLSILQPFLSMEGKGFLYIEEPRLSIREPLLSIGAIVFFYRGTAFVYMATVFVHSEETCLSMRREEGGQREERRERERQREKKRERDRERKRERGVFSIGGTVFFSIGEPRLFIQKIVYYYISVSFEYVFDV